MGINEGGLKVADLLAMATRAERTVPVCMRADIAGKIEDMKDAFRVAKAHDDEHNEDDTAPAIWEQIAGLELEAEAATVDFRVVALPAPEWRRLIRETPPPPGEGYLWDPERFPVAAVAACCAEPKMTLEEAEQIAAALSDYQWMKLFGAVWNVNEGDDLVPKFASVTAALPTSEPSSTTAPPEGSLTASSPD